jgi:hypothetical protein
MQETQTAERESDRNQRLAAFFCPTAWSTGQIAQ